MHVTRLFALDSFQECHELNTTSIRGIYGRSYEHGNNLQVIALLDSDNLHYMSWIVMWYNEVMCLPWNPHNIKFYLKRMERMEEIEIRPHIHQHVDVNVYQINVLLRRYWLNIRWFLVIQTNSSSTLSAPLLTLHFNFTSSLFVCVANVYV